MHHKAHCPMNLMLIMKYTQIRKRLLFSLTNTLPPSVINSRQTVSCQTALIKLVDKWMACIDKGDIVGTLFFGFHKAFDLVNHDILLTKLSTYKFKNSDFIHPKSAANYG